VSDLRRVARGMSTTALIAAVVIVAAVVVAMFAGEAWLLRYAVREAFHYHVGNWPSVAVILATHVILWKAPSRK
jgi:hypothetical protein